MPVVNVPGVGAVQFPDDMSREAIVNAIENDILKKPKKELGVGDYVKDIPKALGRGAVGLLETSGIGASAALPEEYEKQVRAGIEQYAKPVKEFLAPSTPEVGESISSRLASGLGSTAPFFAAGPFGLAGRAIAGGLGVAAGAGEARQAAEQAGATAEERGKATLLGAPTGLLDIIAPEIGPLKGIFTTALARGGVEGLTEAAQKIAQNLIAKGIYNPKQDVLAGSGEEGVYGAGVGALASLLVDLALGRKAKGVTPPPSKALPEVSAAPAAAPQPEALPPQGGGFTAEEAQALRQEADLAEQARLSGIAEAERERAAQLEQAQREQLEAAQEMSRGMPGMTGLPDINRDLMRATREREQQEIETQQTEREIELKRQQEQYQAQVDEIRNTTYSSDPVQNQIVKERLLGNLPVPEMSLDSITSEKSKTIEEPKGLYQPGEPLIKEPQAKPRGVSVEKFQPAEKEEIASLKSSLTDINKQIQDVGKQKSSLFNVLKGQLTTRPGSFSIADIDKDKTSLRQIYNKEGKGVLLEDMVANGSLDPFLPSAQRAIINGQQNPNFDNTAAVEVIADKLRSGDYSSVDEQTRLTELTEQKDRLKAEIERLESVPDINLELAARAGRPKPTLEPSLSNLVEEARAKGVDVEDVQERLALQMPEATPAQFQGALRSALFAATSPSPSYTIGQYEYTQDEIEDAIAERLTDEELQNIIRQTEAQQAAAARAAQVPKPRTKASAPVKRAPEVEKPRAEVALPKTRINKKLGEAVIDNDWGRVTEELQTSNNPIIANIGRLAENLVGVTTQVNPRLMKKSAPGAAAGWSPDTNGIYVLSKAKAANEHVIAHETTHALTYFAIKNPTAAQKPAVNRLRNLFNYVKTHLGDRGLRLYGLKNFEEFIAEANSNQEFQNELRKIPYQKQTAWGAFTKAIADLLGIRDSSALTEILAITEELTSTESKGVLKTEKKPSVAKVITAPESIPQGLEQEGFTRLPKDSPRRYRQGSNSFGTWERDGVRVSLSSNVLADDRGGVTKYMADDGEMTIEALLVDPDKRGKGLAKDALELVTNLADDLGRTLYLEPVQLEKGAGLNEKQLQDLYSRYGFKKTTPSGKVMVRDPQGQPKSLIPLERTQEGNDAMEILAGMGRFVKEPEPGYLAKARQAWDNARDNPQLTKEQAIGGFRRFADQLETWAFSSDAALNNQIRREVMNSTKGQEEKIGMLLNTSLSQTAHSDAIANLFLMKGNIKWDESLHKWTGVDDENNIINLSRQLDVIADKHGLTKEEVELIAHTAFEAKRTRSLIRENAEIEAKADAMKAEASAIRGRSPVAASELSDKANKLLQKRKVIHMSEEQIAAGMSQFQLFPELTDVVKTWDGIRENALSAMVDTGLYSREEAEDLMANADYVPFFREDQIEQGKGPKEFLRSLSVQADKRMKGSEKPVNDIFDNMVRWTQYAINRGVRNRSALALVDTAKEMNLASQVKDPRDGENVVRVWRNGKEEYVSMADPMFVSAFRGLESVAIPTVKFFSKFADVLRQSVVLYPLFSVAQVPQDSFAAMFSSGLKPQHALSIPVRAVKEFIQTLRGKSSTHEELKNVGAVGVRDFTSSIIRAEAEIMSGLKKDPSLWGAVKRKLGNLAMAADNAVRQAAYEAALAQGLTKAEAIEKAFEIFNVRRRGNSQMLAMAGQVIPFFNAYLAAQHVAYRTLTGVGTSPTERKAAFQTLAATTGSVMALSLLYAMMNADDEGYEKKATPTRDRLLIIPGTNGLGIPLRADIFALPKVLAEHTYHLITENGMTDAGKFRASMASLLANSIFSPTPVPQAVKPIAEAVMNYDFFQQKPLVGTFQQHKEVSRQFEDSTSELSKLLGKTELISPIVADHLIRGMFGSFGGLVMYATNPMLAAMAGTTRPSVSFQDALATIPNASGFVSKEYEVGLRKDFYALKEVTDRAALTMSDLKNRSPQEIEDYLEDPKVQQRLALSPVVNRIASQLTLIRKQINLITNIEDERMTSAEKEAQIKQLREAEYQLLKNVNLRQLREMAQV